ncbi:hypothetical protein ACT7CT_24920 [Bacillus sanguinis]
MNDIQIAAENVEDFKKQMKKYAPYNKGGKFRKWYGNQEYVIRYDAYGRELMKTFPGHRHDNPSYYFQEGITWSFISSSAFGVRYSPKGFIFDVGGSSLFPKNDEVKLLLGLLTTKIAYYYLLIMNPTLNFQTGNIANIPIPNWDKHRFFDRENG